MRHYVIRPARFNRGREGRKEKIGNCALVEESAFAACLVCCPSITLSPL